MTHKYKMKKSGASDTSWPSITVDLIIRPTAMDDHDASDVTIASDASKIHFPNNNSCLEETF